MSNTITIKNIKLTNVNTSQSFLQSKWQVKEYLCSIAINIPHICIRNIDEQTLEIKFHAS